MKSLAFKILPSLCRQPSYPPLLDYYYTILSLNARGMSILPSKNEEIAFHQSNLEQICLRILNCRFQIIYRVYFPEYHARREKWIGITERWNWRGLEPNRCLLSVVRPSPPPSFRPKMRAEIVTLTQTDSIQSRDEYREDRPMVFTSS